MAVRLHRARDPLPTLDPEPKAKPAAAPPGPTIGTRAPAIVLAPPKPIDGRQPVNLRGFVKPLLAGAGLATLALSLYSFAPSLFPKKVFVEATPVVTRLDVTSPAKGKIEWIAEPGAVLEPGAEIARIAPPVSSAEVTRAQAALTRAERLLADAKREKARVDDLVRSDRATRRERFEVAAYVHLRQDERDAAKAKLETAREKAKPVVHSVAILERAKVVETLPAGAEVEPGAKVAVVTPPATRLRFHADVKPGDVFTTASGAQVRVLSVDSGTALAETDAPIDAPLTLRIR